MASGGVGSRTIYSGTVSYVTKSYGFISLDGNNPVSTAFFDKASIGGAADDLKDLFSRGCKVRARIGLTDGAHKVNYKAFGLVLANQQLDSSLRGADSYLKKYLENGAEDIDDFFEDLRGARDNCPKVLKNGTIDNLKRVAYCRPDLFEIRNGFICLCHKESEVEELILNKMDKYHNRITLGQVQGILSSNNMLNYLRVDGSWTKGLMDFISRHADAFVCWDCSVWKKDHLLGDPGLNGKFQKELKAVKYYSQFVDDDCAYVTATSLSGHYHQAPEEIKMIVRPKQPDFGAFLQRNSFFFKLDSDGDVENCPNSRLTTIDAFWSKSIVAARSPKKTPASPVTPAVPVLNVFSGFVHVTPIRNNPPNPITDADAFYLGQKDIPPALRSFIYYDNTGKGGEEYLKKYLPETGAKQFLQLICELSRENDPECPTFLKYGHFQELSNLVQKNIETFSSRNGFFCLNSLETDLVFQTFTRVQSGKVLMDELKNIFPPSRQPGRYLFASAKKARDCIKEFLERNAAWFLVWDNSILTYDAVFGAQACSIGIKTSFEREMKAVQFYSRFVDDDGTEISSLRGHFAQASEDVKSVTSAKEEDFTAFLKKNFFFFNVMGIKVKICHKDRLSVIDEYWLNTKTRKAAVRAVPPSVPQFTARASIQPSVSGDQQGSVLTPVLIPRSSALPAPAEAAPQAPAPVKSSSRVSKAFSDAEAELIPGKLNPNPPVVAMTSHAARLSLETSTPAQPSLFQSLGESSEASGGGVYASAEAKMFKKLIGNTASQAIEDELLSASSLNSLLLLRMNIGKPPMAKFRIPGESGGYNHTLKTEPVKGEDLQRMLRHNEVVKMVSPSHYGVKGTLHSIRTMERAGALTGLTLFCQLHEAEDGLGLDVWKGKKLTAVFNANYPVKIIHNYLRCKCERLSRREDVLVIDVDGQLSGCDREPHPSLGNITRRQCSSSCELSQAIIDSIQHMHEYVFVIGVDATEHLKAIQKMCGKDTQVLAEISSDLRSEVEIIFS